MTNAYPPVIKVAAGRVSISMGEYTTWVAPNMAELIARELDAGVSQAREQEREEWESTCRRWPRAVPEA